MSNHLQDKPQIQFQSLIGELKTDYKKERNIEKRRVSIPHRRTKNDTKMKRAQIELASFNPS